MGRVLIFPVACMTPTDAVGPGLTATATLRAWPNPARGKVALGFDLRQGGDIRLEVFDVAGHRVREVLRRHVPAGPSMVYWDGRDTWGHVLPSSIYFVRLSGTAGSCTERVTLYQ